MRNNNYHDIFSFIFSISCLPLLFLEKLPTSLLWNFLFGLFLLLFFLSLFIRKLLLFILTFLLIGFLWSTAAASNYLDLITPYIDKKISVQAQVKSLNTANNTASSPLDNYQYIDFEILQIDNKTLDITLPISLLWADPLVPFAGQIWDLQIKTKVVHGYLNQGGFDRQRFAIANRTLLSGTIMHAKLIDTNLSIKQIITNEVIPYINLFEYRDIMLALGFGDRSELSPQRKELLFKTGIAHLMAISGMHIILVATIGNLLIRALQYFLPNRYISPWQPLFLGWVFALFYAWLSGLNPPAFRAILALTLWCFLRIYCQQLSSWQMINRIMAMLLFFDPLVILSESFWLSFYAVICIIFLVQWFPFPEKMRYKKRWYLLQILYLQIGLTLLLLPIQIYIFQGISDISIIANMIAIPAISLITFPFILFALFFSIAQCYYLALGFWFIAEQSLDILFSCLSVIHSDWISVPHSLYLLSTQGWLLLISFRLAIWRRYWISLALIVLIMSAPLLKRESLLWRVDMLDVGHGLAIVIRKGQSAILYDTGAKWLTSSAAEQIILPFFKWHGLNLDGIIISHQHNDHIGGLAIMQQAYPQAWLMSSTSSLANDYACVSGNVFEWNKLTLNVLWPNNLMPSAFNEESCVIHLTDGQFSLLLTGDLEKQQELQLVLKYKKSLFSTILQIPHHGSNTSSTYPFLNYVNPHISIGSAARYSPWKLPSNKALSRYHERHLDYYFTSTSGQITLLFSPYGWKIETMRNKIKPRWYHDWFGGFTY